MFDYTNRCISRTDICSLNNALLQELLFLVKFFILNHLRGVRGEKYEMQENCVFNNCKCPAPYSSVMKAVGSTSGNNMAWEWRNMTWEVE